MRAVALLASAVLNRTTRLTSAVMASSLLATPPWAKAEGAEAGTAPDFVPAVWAPQELVFELKDLPRFGTAPVEYTCQEFRDKVLRLLLALGARKDLRVDKKPCTDTRYTFGYTTSLTPQVSIRMQVLRAPAEPRPDSNSIPAHWKSIDLTGRQAPLDVDECELAKQVVEVIVPLFSTRNLDYSSPDCHRTVAPVVHLHVEVLATDQK